MAVGVIMRNSIVGFRLYTITCLRNTAHCIGKLGTHFVLIVKQLIPIII